MIASILGKILGGTGKLIEGRANGGPANLHRFMAAIFAGLIGGSSPLASASIGDSGGHAAAFRASMASSNAMVSSAPRAAPPPPRV